MNFTEEIQKHGRIKTIQLPHHSANFSSLLLGGREGSLVCTTKKRILFNSIEKCVCEKVLLTRAGRGGGVKLPIGESWFIFIGIFTVVSSDAKIFER